MPYQSKYRANWYEFTEHPNSDSCWSLSTGPDGRIYAAACSENRPGQTVKIVRYNEQQDKLDYLFDMDEMVNDPKDSGRATQCKVHYSFVPSMHDGIMYMATHLSGPPIGEIGYSPWRSWYDEECFRGAALVAYDTQKDTILWWDTILPKEGCRCLLHDEERGLLYALSYPRDHLFQYHIENRELRDLGRIGSINAQALILDKHHRVWTSSDDGRMVRYDPETNRLEASPYILPHEQAFQNGWHSVLYDAVISPEQDCLYGVTWIAQPHLFRLWLYEGEWGRLEDLGCPSQRRDTSIPINTFIDHCGALVFGADGLLYYGVARWHDPEYHPLSKEHEPYEGVIFRLDPKTLEREEVCVLERPKYFAQYVSRGAIDHNGNLFFGNVGAPPVGIFKMTLPEHRRKENAHLPIRIWG